MSSSKTLIDNILINEFPSDIISGNLTISLSDHIPQFAIIPLKQKNYLPKNHNIKIRDLKNVDYYKLNNDLLSINWYYTNQTNKSNVNEDTSTFIKQVNSIIDKNVFFFDYVIVDISKIRKYIFCHIGLNKFPMDIIFCDCLLLGR